MNNLDYRQNFETAIKGAIENGNTEELCNSYIELCENVANEKIRAFEGLSAAQRQDAEVLASRGVRQLTSEENAYFTELAAAMGSRDVRQALTNIDKAFPQTVLDAVMDDIKTEFPLLDAIDVQSMTIVGKLIYNKQTLQLATWDSVGTAISTSLNGEFGAIDIGMCKLTAYLPVSKDYLRMGPAWLEAYVRAVLVEANGAGLEAAVCEGTGNKCPIGMAANLSSGTITADGTVTYSLQSATSVTSFDAETYGGLVASLAQTASGRARAVSDLILVVNPANYYSIVMPATTMLVDGGYVNNVLPVPTKIIQSTGVTAGKAILGLGKRYLLGVCASNKEGFIEYSDDAAFLADNRLYTTHLYANGCPKDKYAFKYLDISSLAPTYPTVHTITDGE